MRFLVPVGVGGVDGVLGGGGDGQAEHLGEAEWEDEAGVGPGEGLDAGDVRGLVDGVVGCVGGPACAEAEDGGGEGEDGAGFDGPRGHGEVLEAARVGEFAEDDEEDYEAWDPGIEFVLGFGVSA